VTVPRARPSGPHTGCPSVQCSPAILCNFTSEMTGSPSRGAESYPHQGPQARRRPNWASTPVQFSILQDSSGPGLQVNSVSYKGFAITARTFQIRASGRWTLDLLIGRHRSLRAFSAPRTYPTEESAITGCCEFGQRIIDGRVRNCSVDGLS
jgi:hypothetical protein